MVINEFLIFKEGLITIKHIKSSKDVILIILLFVIKLSIIECKIDKNKEEIDNISLKSFIPVNEEILEGPITINKKLDDGTKRNLYSIINSKNDNFYYDYKNFNILEDTTKIMTEYLCELKNNVPQEYYKGYDIICPDNFSIIIDKVFYGRYANDTENCNIGFNNKVVPEKFLKVSESCGYEPLKYIKELCEGRVYCSIIPINSIFSNKCNKVYKYLNLNYHCIKDSRLTKPKISIVMFSNKIAVNTIDENAVSEFYQYSKIHGYDFTFNSYNYNPIRKIHFMKFCSIIENLIIGLKEKKYDWIFWADSDVVITNPNIKLESFLPDKNMNKIHFIAASDHNGLNDGVFFIRVHPWSLNILMRAMSYNYFNNDKKLKFNDQSSLNNVLTEFNELDHVVIVPQSWFNNYRNKIKKGDFLLHLTGKRTPKDEYAKLFREKMKNEDGWYNKTNEEMRKEVLEYYKIPKKYQFSIKPE